jgi:phage terminase large subunit-like protein
MSIKPFSSSDLSGAEDLRRLYKAAYKAGVAISPELEAELRAVCLESEIVPVSPCGKYWFDAEAGERVIKFFREYLVHIKGELGGKPIELMEWEKDQVIRPLFGWRRWDGLRRYRELWLEVPRKNDKTTLSAGLALFLTFADGEPGAEVYSAAADRDQAGICFGIARSMVESSPPLNDRCDLVAKAIVVPATFSAYKVLSSDAYTKHGLNAHGIVVDEVHAQPNRDLIDVLHTSTGSRRQPLEIYITTAGHDRHSIAYEKHSHALRVRDDATVDERVLPVIYAADPLDDWRDERTWIKANPGLGASKKWDYMRGEFNKAVQIPAYENTFKRLDLNIWTEQASRWLPMEKWDLCVGPIDDPLKLRAAMRGMKCWGGLDLANTIDINAFVLVFLPGNMRLVLVPFFWIPEERLKEREKVDRVPWALWVKAGLVSVMPGAAADYDMIESDIVGLSKSYQIEELGIDRWNALAIATGLENGPAGKAAKARRTANRKSEPFVVGVGQGFASMTMPCKVLEAAVVAKRLEHAGHPILRWMASNVAAERDAADNVKPDKESSADKIDGISASLDGMARAFVHQPQGSIEGWLNNPVTAN